MTEQLIPIQEGFISGCPSKICNARDLHNFLGVGARFNDWFSRRISEYNFLEGDDFNEYYSDMSKTSEGGRPKKDYHLTLDTAKELAMIERTPKGREARQYFIRCEKELLATKIKLPHSPPDTPLFSRLDAGLMRELRRVNPNLVQAYLMAYGVTPEYISGLIGNTPPIPLPEPQTEVAPINFLKERLVEFSSGDDALAFYFTREKFSLLCDGYDLRETAQWLRDLGYLRADNNRLTYKGPRSIFKGARRNVFAIFKSILDEDLKEYCHG